MNEFLPEIGEALDHFFDRIIMPGDTLKVFTPVTAYYLKAEALKRLSRKEIADQLKEKIKGDIDLGTWEYRSLMKNLRDIIVSEEDDDPKERIYLDAVRKLKDLKSVDSPKLLAFADHLKSSKGQNSFSSSIKKRSFPFYRDLMTLPCLS